MTRNRKAAVPLAVEAAAPAAPDPMAAGVGAARQWMCRSLQAAQNGAGWLEELQREAVLATTGWVETLALGARQAQQAEGIDELAAVPMRMLERELEAGARRFGEGLRRLLDGEIEWFDEMRQHALAVAPGESAEAPAALPLQDLSEPWRRALGDWQSMARRWAEGLNAASATRH